MSLQRECTFFEPVPGKWFYLLNDSNLAHQWDWREGADCYGPFPTECAALDHLHENHANPGGYNVVPNSDFRPDKIYEAKVKSARVRVW